MVQSIVSGEERGSRRFDGSTHAVRIDSDDPALKHDGFRKIKRDQKGEDTHERPTLARTPFSVILMIIQKRSRAEKSGFGVSRPSQK